MTQSQNIHTQQNSAKYAKGNSLTKQTQAKIRQLLKLPTDEIGKAVIALVLFIFVINIHFILFLRLKEQQHSPVMSVQSHFKNLTFWNIILNSIIVFLKMKKTSLYKWGDNSWQLVVIICFLLIIYLSFNQSKVAWRVKYREGGYNQAKNLSWLLLQ